MRGVKARLVLCKDHTKPDHSVDCQDPFLSVAGHALHYTIQAIFLPCSTKSDRRCSAMRQSFYWRGKPRDGAVPILLASPGFIWCILCTPK